MKNVLLATLLAIVFLGCGSGDSNSNETEVMSKDVIASPVFDESLRGEWLYIHNNTKVYIDENFSETITKIDENLIKVSKNSTSYHLMRYGNKSATVKGNLYEQSTSIKKSISRLGGRRIGGMDIVLKHYSDKKNNKETVVEGIGDFEFQNVQTGDYTLIASSVIGDTSDKKETVQAKVSVQGEEISLGRFKLVSDDGYNFKTEFIIDNSEGGYFFGNQVVYSGKMVIKNIGNKEGTGLNYTFKSDSPYISSMSSEIVLGTADVNSSINIPFHISFNILDKSSVSIPVEVLIKDANNNEWYDTVFFNVYQTPMYLQISTKEANVKGYIIENGHNLKQIDTSNTTIVLPYKAGENYYLVLSNPNADNETPYSIAIDADTLDFSTFQNTGIFEPNNKESEATTLKMNEAILSYLHKGDIDYFVIDMSSLEDMGQYSPPQMPFK